MNENRFINECQCTTDYEVLFKAINKKCKSLNCYCRESYRIILRNGYPTVCINRERFYVHRLIGEYLYDGIRKNYVIHHLDRNKLNAMPNNLVRVSRHEHDKLHGEEHKGHDFRTEEGKRKAIMAAVAKRKRKDVTAEKILELKAKGYTF